MLAIFITTKSLKWVRLLRNYCAHRLEGSEASFHQARLSVSSTLTEMLSIAHGQKTVYLQQALLAALRSGKWRCRSLLMIGFSCILSITIGSNPYLVCLRSSQRSIVTLLQSQWPPIASNAGLIASKGAQPSVTLVAAWRWRAQPVRRFSISIRTLRIAPRTIFWTWTWYNKMCVACPPSTTTSQCLGDEEYDFDDGDCSGEMIRVDQIEKLFNMMEKSTESPKKTVNLFAR